MLCAYARPLVFPNAVCTRLWKQCLCLVRRWQELRLLWQAYAQPPGPVAAGPPFLLRYSNPLLHFRCMLQMHVVFPFLLIYLHTPMLRIH